MPCFCVAKSLQCPCVSREKFPCIFGGLSVGRTRSESARSKANTSIICRAALTDAHSGARNSKSFLSLFVCVCTETASPRYFIAPFYKVPGVRCPPSRIATCICSNVHLQQFTAPSELHAPPLLQLAPLGKSALLPHCLTLTSPALYPSLPPPEAATLQHLSLLCATPRPGGATVLQLDLLHGLKHDLLATPLFSLQTSLLQRPPSISVIGRPNLRSFTTTTTNNAIQQHQQHRLATQHRRPIAPSPSHNSVLYP